MASEITQQHSEQVESLIDSIGVAGFLHVVEEILNGKADHLRTNWQDANAARVFEQVAQRVAKATNKAIENNI